jgi:hypothetical protein
MQIGSRKKNQLEKDHDALAQPCRLISCDGFDFHGKSATPSLKLKGKKRSKFSFGVTSPQFGHSVM